MAGFNPPPEGAAVSGRPGVVAARFGGLGLALGNERVCLVGELGNGEQVDESEALRGLPLAPLGIDPRKGDVVMGDPAGLVFPNGRLDGSDSEFRCGFISRAG